MDPIAHTLAGATLSQAGLKKLTPLATATLVIGANLPDVDGVMSFFGADASLYYRRGITHGLAAQLGFPFLLTAGMLTFDHLVRRRRRPESPAARPLQIFLLACIAVVSHSFLDWLNTYGVRLLMPFSERWFYGDTLFIIDAWMWLLMGASAVFAYSQTRWKQSLWAALGVAASWLVSTADFVPLPARIIWWVGVAFIVALRFRGVAPASNQRIAWACLMVFVLYVGGLSIGSIYVQDRVRNWLWETHGEELTDVMIGPLPANPLAREIIAVNATHYYGLRATVFDADIVERFQRVPLPRPDPVVQAALRNPSVRGFVSWMRFPVYEVRKVDSAYRVILRDLRYVRPDQDEGRGIGMAEILVTQEMLNQAESSP